MGKKNLYYFSFFLLTILSFVRFDSVAQDSGSPSFEAYDRGPLERVLYTHGDSTNDSRSLTRDSIAVRMQHQRNVYKPSSVVPKQKDKNDESNDNSILSFNFLYYLIQKYKMQDIVD